MSIEGDVLKAVRPTPAQDKKVAAVVEALSDEVVAEARRLKVHLEPMLVGSVAKGTHLKDPDIDLFMLFPESTSLEQLRDSGLAIGRKVLNGKEHYAQHPYVRGNYKGFQVDLVPCFKIRDTKKKMSAVDRTPFHTEFVKKNLKKGMADEVRLLKRFMKGVNCYGAEAKVEGFSGYLCELLVMRFGTFRQVLEAAKDWKVGDALHLPDCEGKEFDEPFAFIDPVDSSRNVASAVSIGTLLRLVMASREYLATPDMKFFFPSPVEKWTAAKIRAAAGDKLDNMISVSFQKIDLVDDVVYPQLRKSLSAMTSLLEREEFVTEKTSIHVGGRTHLLMELESITLPSEKKHRGPPVSSENAKEFLTKWNSLGLSKPFAEDGRWYVMTNRKYARADELLKAKISDIPLGKDVKKLKKYEIESGSKLLSDENLEALTRHLDDRMPWQR